MIYNQCQKDLIYYVMDYNHSPDVNLTPCIEVFKQIFHEKYSDLEIEENVRELVSSGILRTYSFHTYLNFSEIFITRKDYKLFKEKKI